MRFYDILAEALKFSQVRPFMKDWNKERYSEIFLNPKYKHDKKGYRIFIPLEEEKSNTEKSPTHKKVEEFLNQNGFEIVDYIKGIVRNTEKNQNIKIGKVLTKLKPTETVMVDTKDGPKNLPLIDAFAVDKTREGTRNEYVAVISRHPYDIAGMSTNRGWTSCMNLDTGINRHYVPIDITAGSVVAYVTNKNDPNLKNPTGRVLIKPFVDVLGSPEVLFGIEERVYGTNVPGFLNSVKKWVNEVNNSKILNDVAIFRFNPNLYADSGLASQTIIKGTKLTDEEKNKINDLNEYPHDIFNDKNPSDALRIVAITSNRGFGIFREMLKYDDYIPSFKVQLAGVTKDYSDIIPLMQKMYPENKIDLKIYDTAINGMTNDNDITANSARSLSEFAEMLITYDIKLPAESISKIINNNPKFLGGFIKQGYDFNKDYIIKIIQNTDYPEGVFDNLIKSKVDIDEDIDLAVITNNRSRITNQTMSKIIQLNLQRNKRVPEKIKSAILNRNPQLIESFIRNREKYNISITNDEIVDCIISERMPEEDFTSVVGKIFDIGVKFEKEEIEKIISKLEGGFLIFILDMLKSFDMMTDEIARFALKKTEYALEFITEKEPDDYKYALRRSFRALDYIERPAFEHLEYAIKRTYEDEYKSRDFDIYDRALDRSSLNDDEKTNLLYFLVKQVPGSIIGIVKNHKKYNLSNAIQRAAINGGYGQEMITEMYNYDVIPNDTIIKKFLDHVDYDDFIYGNIARFITIVSSYIEKNPNYRPSYTIIDKISENKEAVSYIINRSYDFPIKITDNIDPNDAWIYTARILEKNKYDTKKIDEKLIKIISKDSTASLDFADLIVRNNGYDADAVPDEINKSIAEKLGNSMKLYKYASFILEKNNYDPESVPKIISDAVINNRWGEKYKKLLDKSSLEDELDNLKFTPEEK